MQHFGSLLAFLHINNSPLFQEFIERLHELHEEWLLGPQSASLPAPVVVSIAGFIQIISQEHTLLEGVTANELMSVLFIVLYKKVCICQKISNIS